MESVVFVKSCVLSKTIYLKSIVNGFTTLRILALIRLDSSLGI